MRNKINIIRCLCPDCRAELWVEDLKWEVKGCEECRHLIPIGEWFVQIQEIKTNEANI